MERMFLYLEINDDNNNKTCICMKKIVYNNTTISVAFSLPK